MVKHVYWVIWHILPVKRLKKVLWNLSILISILIYLLLLVLSISIIAPGLAEQYRYLTNLLTSEVTYTRLTQYMHEILNTPLVCNLKQVLDPNLISVNQSMLLKIGVFARGIAAKFVGIISSIIYSAHNLIAASIAFVAAFHIVREWDSWSDRLEKIETIDVLAPYSDRIQVFADFCSTKMQGWIQGQLVITFIMCIYYSICFMALGLKTSILLGILFGFASFVPYISDIICYTLLATNLISINAGIVKAVVSILIVSIGHGLSGYIIGPFLIGKTTKLNVLQVIIGFIVHMRLFGVAGIILNIPFCIITNGLLKMIFDKPNSDKNTDDA